MDFPMQPISFPQTSWNSIQDRYVYWFKFNYNSKRCRQKCCLLRCEINTSRFLLHSMMFQPELYGLD